MSCQETQQIGVTLTPTTGTTAGSWGFDPTSCVSVPAGVESWDVHFVLNTPGWAFKAVTFNQSPDSSDSTAGVTVVESFQGTKAIPGGNLQVSQLDASEIVLEITNSNDTGADITFGVYLTVASTTSDYQSQTSKDPQIVLKPNSFP